MMREVCGKFAGTLRAEIPPYPLEVFPPLRGVGKTSGREAGERRKGLRSPAWRLRELMPSRRWLSRSAISFTYVRPPVRGVRHND